MSQGLQSVTQAEIEVGARSNGTLVRLSGRIDIDYSPLLRCQLLALLQDSDAKRITIDLSAATHVDSSGIATLVEALKVAYSRKTELRLQGLQPDLLQLLQMAGILKLFTDPAGQVTQTGEQDENR